MATIWRKGRWAFGMFAWAAVGLGCDGGGPDAGECILDCFPGVTCSGSTLTSFGGPLGGTFPCDQVPACPDDVTTCPLGCIGDVSINVPISQNIADYAWTCAAEQPADAGDACVTDDDCHPTYAVPTSMGGLTQQYLRCDGVACVAAAAPDVPGFGGACSPGLGPSTSAVVVWVDDPARGAGAACLVASSPTCAHESATIVCAGDWDCPAMARCDRAIPRRPGGGSTVGVCRVGALPITAPDLPCAPAS